MNGILIINKDLGYTSRDVVNIISKTFQTKKVGHTGTLDPEASGVLVVCIGKALKVCELLTNHDKEYIAGITLVPVPRNKAYTELNADTVTVDYLKNFILAKTATLPTE